MVAIHKKSKFDPAAHLHKHGWKGKGTALKHGHAIKPLAVVQKKTLSGIGKDRDEAVPFWDHIFAATAASLFSSPSPSVSPGPSSWAPPPVQADTKGRIISKPHELIVAKPKLSINAAARAGRELARRGLYSRFLRGKVLHIKESDEEESGGSASGVNTPKDVEEVEEALSDAGPSRMAGVAVDEEIVKSDRKGKKREKGKGKAKEEESTEERRARKAEKARRKAEKGKIRMAEGEGKNMSEVKSDKKKKKRKQDEGELAEAGDLENSASTTKAEKKRKRKQKASGEQNSEVWTRKESKSGDADEGIETERKKKKKKKSA
ncbi:hypothetical protein I302_107113 [Kwoniella bestiolae CBS 10118]|uniref:G-patch domain-containing protein n=1 Tax=Kwoniella bestiolae CBS 10118 TaxID=1296100 RepID=A0A1B9FZH0_9TREE|nr:hypothetical protein I302_05622 [Kwoniella bestiolae CBS 10118]OCF24163.1 hypothetical protein I302_05622 [Kwoniella bestiolae CBS 10118]